MLMSPQIGGERDSGQSRRERRKRQREGFFLIFVRWQFRCKKKEEGGDSGGFLQFLGRGLGEGMGGRSGSAQKRTPGKWSPRGEGTDGKCVRNRRDMWGLLSALF